MHAVGLSTCLVLALATDTPQVEHLFNGGNLDGWYTWLQDTKYDDPRNVYSVVDGQLRISGGGFGYLATRNTYRDYHLVVEFRWGDHHHDSRVGKARDAGLFLHATGRDGNSADGDGAFMAAIECQIMEAAVGDLMLIRGRDNGQKIPLQLTTTIAKMRDAEGWPYYAVNGDPCTLKTWGRVNRWGKRKSWRDTLKIRDTSQIEKVDAWNRLECRCQADNIQVMLNGQIVNVAHRVQPRTGKILLQCEGSEIFFRRVDLMPLAR